MEEVKTIGNFEVYVLSDYSKMGEKAAELIASQITSKPTSVIGFATGSTPISTYESLIALYKAKKIDFSQITAFNLDEYYPLSKTSDQSYDYFMKSNLFNHINVDFKKLNIPNGESDNALEECASYEQKIKSANGIDLQILGIGNNGHIGFNEPDDIFAKETNYVALQQSTIDANARFFASKDDVPKHALSMGIRTIMQARKIILLANGESKAEIIKKMIMGDITPKIPASVLQLHQNVIVVLDNAAAKELEKQI